jgi:hypothetical protein
MTVKFTKTHATASALRIARKMSEEFARGAT